MKTILVPIDFSLNTAQAIRFAVAIAQKLNVGITLLHAYSIDPVYSIMAFPARLIEEEISSAQIRAVTRLKSQCRLITEEEHLACEPIAEFGRPEENIRRFIRRAKPTLVVMGTYGADTWTDRWFGSTTAHIISRSRSPVLAVPLRIQKTVIKHIALATDPEEDHALLLKKIIFLQTLFSAQITVVWIIFDLLEALPGRKILQEFRQYIHQKLPGAAISTRLIAGEQAEEILGKLARSRHYDLLVMLTHSRSLWQRLTDPSLTSRTANYLKIPLLAIPV